MDLSLIIISWNVAELLEQCLLSLEVSDIALVAPDGSSHGAGLRTQVIVVDSASKDNTVQMVRDKFSWVHLYPQTENIGFVRGNNLGLQYATGRAIMLLNPDTEVHPRALTRLMQVLESDAPIGVVGPHTLNSDGSHQSTRRLFPTLLTGIIESTWLESMAPRSIMNHFRVEDRPDNDVFPVDWVQGSAMMARAEVWQQVGPLDERYIMFSEELDWCKRAKAAGWRVYYVGDAMIVHHSGRSTAQVKTRSIVHFQHSKVRYFRKFHGLIAAAIIHTVIIIHYIWQLLLESSKWLAGHRRELRTQRIRAYSVVLYSLLGGGEQVVN